MLTIVDPHVHFWDVSTHRYPWMESTAENFLGDARPLRNTYLPSHLLADAGADVSIEAVVHIDANHDPADPVEETRWLNEQAAAEGQHGFPQAIVAAADFSRADVQRTLEAHLQHRNVRGIRQILNVHDKPLYDYVGRHYLREPQWRQGFKLLERFGLSFDLQIYPSQAEEAAQLARDNPGTALILNHTGMFVDRDQLAGWRAWRNGLRTLAACPNVSVKISGLGMFDHAWTVESLRPYVLEAIDAFGTERAMFASNFPVDRLFSTYTQLWQAFASITAGFSADECDALFRANARRAYRL